MDQIPQLIVLFFVIFDPFVSFSVFFVATKGMGIEERRRTALVAIAVAALLSYSVLFLGELLLDLFSVSLEDFKVAGGVILAILSVQMVLGKSTESFGERGEASAVAVAAIIATPLLTGPAAITAIIVTVQDIGMWETLIAVTVVLTLTALLLLQAHRLKPYVGNTAIQVMSTLLGLITLAWGVKFIREGLGI